MTDYSQQPNPYGYQQTPMYPPVMPVMPQMGPPPHLLANQGLRLVARILDTVFLIALVAAVVLPLILVGGENSVTGAIAIAVILGALVLYEPLQTWRFGATLGKRICKLRIVRLEDGDRLSFGRALGRYGSQFLLGIIPLVSLLDDLWCCWDRPNRQCLHDKMATTVVITGTW
ncbi:RDD family protein [Streptomyces palmae]|uniref:RDD family protein n=1 Tax=Streptomyces palmae TaxID=1701085 RepID=A0A4Z0HDE0_9ACTN|nr:RDD family protein [Streptomyces palmae]TGB16607.1 RDD family protein [Streptomyces palmae]